MFQDRKSVLFAAITLVFIQYCTAGRITNLTVPRWVQNGTEDRVLLDCEYEYNQDEEKFILKWYFNDDRHAAYQWIPNLNSRSFSNQFGRFADWEHYLKDADKFNKYRQIILKRPTTEFTGEYKCHVISKWSTDEKTAFMTVYAPAKHIKFNYNILPNKTVNVSCEVDGVFPKPEVELFYLLQDETEPREMDIDEDFFERTEDSYRIGVSALIPLSELDKENDSDFSCVVTIDPDVYQERRRILFHPEKEINALGKYQDVNNSSPNIFSSFFLITIIILLIC